MKTNVLQPLSQTSRSDARRSQRRAGFTLAEALIATAVVGISFISLYAGLVQGDHIIQDSGQDLRASQIMGQQMEIVRLYTWNQLTNNGYVPTTFTNNYYPGGLTNGTAGVTYSGTLTITNTPLTETYNGDLREVIVNVTWTNGPVMHQRQMTTFVSHYGMQNYIYK